VTDELRTRIESLLALADQATDPQNNGLFDREDLVRLISNFSQLTRSLLSDQDRLKCDQDEMIRRLQRTPFHAEAPGVLPS
jgi:hypothetical protein